MIEVAEIKHTTIACPSQFEGKTKDGRAVYARFRWGYLSVYLGVDTQIFGRQLSDTLDGMLDYEQLVEATAGIIRWPAHCQEYEW